MIGGHLQERRMALGHSLLLDARCLEQDVALRTGYFEEPVVQAALALPPEQPFVLDIGANIGFYTCPLGLKCKTSGGRIYAFEPVKANVRRLKQNLKLNQVGRDVVRILPFALGEAKGVHRIFIEPQGDTNNAVCEFMTAPHDRANMTKERWLRQRVIVRRLDDWEAGASLKNIHLIKMDVEGAELKILRAGSKTIQKFRPVVLAEFNAYWMAQIGQSILEVLHWFDALNYELCREEGHGFRILERKGCESGADMSMPMYLAFPREKRAWVGERVGIFGGS